jgi:hypothetical protein
MKILRKLFLWAVAFNLCSSGLARAERPAAERKPVGLIRHRLTANFVDIEVSSAQVWFGCSRGPVSGNASMVFYVLDGETNYFFFYRSVRYDLKMCREIEAEYRRITRGAPSVRIVGIHPDEHAGPMKHPDKAVPVRFTKPPKIVSSVFIRLQAQGRCKAYFSDDCDLPKNYWGGLIPGS